MPADVRRAKNDSESIEAALEEFTVNVTYTSIDHLEITREQMRGGYVTIAILYTA